MSEQPKITVIHQPASQKEVGCTSIIVEVSFIGAIVGIAVIFWYWLGW